MIHNVSIGYQRSFTPARHIYSRADEGILVNQLRSRGSRVMKRRVPASVTQEFLEVAMRILKREKEFLEKIGRL